MLFTACPYLYPFQTYSRSNSEVSIHRTRNGDLRWVNVRNFFISGPKFTNFFCSTPGWSNNVVDRLSISQSIPEIFAVKFKFFYIAPDLGRFLLSQILREWCPQKVVHRLTPRLVAHHVVKFCGSNPLSSKVIDTHTLHFTPIFDPNWKKIVKEPPGEITWSLTCKSCSNHTLLHISWIFSSEVMFEFRTH